MKKIFFAFWLIFSCYVGYSFVLYHLIYFILLPKHNEIFEKMKEDIKIKDQEIKTLQNQLTVKEHIYEGC